MQRADLGSHRATPYLRRTAVLPAAALALFVLLAAGASLPQDTRADGESVTVRLTPDAYAMARDVEALRTVDYGAFVLLELSPDAYDDLRARGVELMRRPASTKLLLQGTTIDTRSGSRRELATPGVWGDGFHLIQLIGPAKNVWIASLEAAGIELLQYYDPNAFLIRAKPDELAAVGGLDFVAWMGPYLPEYRVSSDLLTRSGRIENVSVTIYDGATNHDTVGATIAAIQQLGGILVERGSARGADRFVTVLFALPATSVRPVARLSDATWLNFRAPFYPDEDEMSAQIIAGNTAPLNPGYNGWQAGVGVTGNGVTVAVLDRGYDTGVDATAHPDLSGRTIMVADSVGIPMDMNGHGTHVGGIVAGNASLGTADASGFLMGLGVAPQATLVVRRRTVDSDAAQTRDAVINGAVASNHSYGLHGAGIGYTDRDRTYDILVRDADQTTGAVAEPLVIVFSSGNSGASGPTKEPKNVIAVASTFNQRDGMGNPGFNNINAVTGSSSQGPAGDGRVFPHVAAPGGNVISTRFSAAASCATIAVGAPAADPTYSMCSGTSMAAPHVTGSVALLTQWWRTFNGGANPSPALVKALLVNGAVDMGVANVPNGSEGWGRINLTNVINTGLSTLYTDQTTVFTDTGLTFVKTFSADDVSQPVRVTLAWSDAPGPGGGGNPATLVNDLDLVVNDSGTVYLGNDFANGLSTTGGAADGIDNLENVFLANPGASNFLTVTVTAAGINGDGVPYNGDATDQDFALVCSNAVPNVSAPTAQCQDVSVDAGPTCTAPASIDDGSFDGDSDPVTLIQDPAGPYALGDTLVTLTVTDDKGASDTCTATVTVVDVTPPDITCPSDVTIECGESTDPTNTGMSTATDNCDPDPTISFADNVVPTPCPADPVQEVIERTWSATDFANNSNSCQQDITVLKLVLELDIKPGSCPNAYNFYTRGKVPVSLVGTPGFDVTTVDLSTLLISRADCVGGAVAPIRSNFEDAATPLAGALCDCHELTGDGILDLSLKFDRRDLDTELELGAFSPGDSVELVLSGTLAGGCEFIASDCISIR